MPRPGTSEELKRRVWEIVENNPRLSAGEIHLRLRAAAKQSGESLPVVRTIGRIKREYLLKQPTERLPYRHVSWPESFASGALPWESSAAVLALIRHSRAVGNPERPTVHLAQLFWRLTMAAPDMSLAERADFAQYYESADRDPEREKRIGGIEEYLLRTPWRSKAAAASWKKTVKAEEIPGCPGIFGPKGWFRLPATFAALRKSLDSGEFEKALQRKYTIVGKKLGREATTKDVIEWETKQSRKERKK